MTTNAITYYPILIKSYLVDKAKNSAFNTPVVRTALVTSTVVFTGITTAYFIKKINNAIQIALKKPVETACITAAIVSTGVVIAHHPIWTMILFVGISFILLNKQAYTKIQEINKVSKDFFINSPFIKKILVSFGTDPKLLEDANSTSDDTNSENRLSITQAIQLLNFGELQFKTLQSDDISSNDPIAPAEEEVTSEDSIDNLSLSEENDASCDAVLLTTVVPTHIELVEVTSEDISTDTPQLSEEDTILDDTILPVVHAQEENISNDAVLPTVVPTHIELVEVTSEDTGVDNTQPSEENAHSSDTIPPSSLGLLDQIKLMNLNFKNIETNPIKSKGNSLLVGVAKTINEFNLDGLNLEKLNLGGLDQQEYEKSLTDNSSVTLPIKPVTFPSVGTWSNHKPLKKPDRPILINPLVTKIGISANKMVKTSGTLLNLLRKIPK